MIYCRIYFKTSLSSLYRRHFYKSTVTKNQVIYNQLHFILCLLCSNLSRCMNNSVKLCMYFCVMYVYNVDTYLKPCNHVHTFCIQKSDSLIYAGCYMNEDIFENFFFFFLCIKKLFRKCLQHGKQTIAVLQIDTPVLPLPNDTIALESAL